MIKTLYMRRSSIAFSLISALILFAGCQKENPTVSASDNQGQPQSGTTGKYLVSSAPTGVQSLDEVRDSLSADAERTGSFELGSVINGVVSPLFSGIITGDQWQLETYRIVYNTKDARGNDIQLSGDIGFISEASGRVDRKLESVSVFHTTFNVDDDENAISNTSMGNRDIVIPARALHNALAVFPHYQGAGIDKGKHMFTPSEPLLKARQAIDCELAALEFINSLDYIRMDDNYYTENMGASNGSSPALAMQYLLENDGTIAEKAGTVRLKSTYLGEGLYRFKDVFLNIANEKNPESSSMDKYTPYVLMSAIAGAFDTWPEEFTSRGISSVEEIFSPAFLGIRVNHNGSEIGMLELLATGDCSVDLFGNTPFEDKGLTLRTILNPEILHPMEGTVKEDSKYVQALLAAFEHNELIAEGWNPVSSLKFVHSQKDEFVPYEDVLKVYNNLNRNGRNKNVKIEKINVNSHLLSTYYLIFRDIVGKKHPSSVN